MAITRNKIKRIPRTFRKWYRERFRSPYVVLVRWRDDVTRVSWHYASSYEDALDWAEQYPGTDAITIFHCQLGVPLSIAGERGLISDRIYRYAAKP